MRFHAASIVLTTALIAAPASATSLPGIAYDREDGQRLLGSSERVFVNAVIDLRAQALNAQRSAASTGAAWLSRPSAAAIRDRRSRISAASFAHNVAWPTLRPGRALLP